MTKQEQVKAIFIEEAEEIIEKLDIDIIRFEEDSNDYNLLNEIFRGVHTLKGNANAFGFTRLGEFVHHFEDLLDYYRNTHDPIEENNLDLFVTSVDVIKEVMECELKDTEQLPFSYAKCLEGIKKLLAVKKNEPLELETSTTQKTLELNDLSEEFSEDCNKYLETSIAKSIQEHQKIQEDGFNLFGINLTLDNDCYQRGFEHLLFIKNLAEKAKSIESFFDMQNVDIIDKFESDISVIHHIWIVLLTPLTQNEVEEYFEYLFDNEYSIQLIQQEVVQKKEKKSNTVKQNISIQKSTIRIDTFKLDELFDSVGELVIAQNFIAQNKKIQLIEDESITRTIETLSKITKRIQDRVMSLRMVAIKDTFDKMKRVVRDTSKKTSKEIQLIIQGEETEIDKTMIDSLSDPLIHIIRNAIDHGLEANAQERKVLGKNVEGKIILKAFHKSGSIIISVSDDGRGINKERVFQKALQRGIISGDENLSDSQIFGLIMQPGFSTADTISDLSGRGVGLDVVRTSIEKLRGKIEIDSKENEGTTFSMVLPLTLAIIDGMLVRISEDIYIIPTLSVVESFCPKEDIVHLVKDKGEFVNLRGENIPIVHLSDVFNLQTKKIKPWEGILVCIETESGKVAILVDELVGQQQVVIKSLGKGLAHLKEVSGGAILGNGDIALILNVDALRSLTENSHA